MENELSLAVLKVRCNENVVLDNSALLFLLLTRIASECSLPYAIHLISISQLYAIKHTLKEPSEEQRYLLTFKCSKQLLIDEYHSGYIFNEISTTTPTTAAATTSTTTIETPVLSKTTITTETDLKNDIDMPIAVVTEETKIVLE